MDGSRESDPDHDGAADPPTHLLHRTYDWSVTAPIVAIAEALSTLVDATSTEIAPVQSSVDGDALDRVLRSSRDGDARVSFPHGDYVVSVTGTGDLYLFAR
ncbi:HalOD1 output domain-containing protein [Halobaculum lipolyticum]|uniref:HalOD1 output domain-containing protein n=1 Tax=Halobaculum lipolyticum TaxID=3032001 RepID=A0ABD5WA37_9EURY|nr:HalOD1 output domain-containing protein [Halobaculum sp. DT31]